MGPYGKTQPILPLPVIAENLLLVTNRFLKISKEMLFCQKSRKVPKSRHTTTSAASKYPFNFTIESRLLISMQQLIYLSAVL